MWKEEAVFQRGRKPHQSPAAPPVLGRGSVSSLGVYSHMKGGYNQGDEVKQGP